MSAGRMRLALALLLGLAAFALYGPSLRSGLVYDAEIQIQHDSYLHTPSHLADVLTLRVLRQDVLDGTRPVHLFFLLADSLLWGRQPFGYHLTSNLLHALNAALLFLLLTRLGGPAPASPRVLGAAALGTLLFVAHPALVEAISEVSDREDPLAVFFTLLALTFAARYPARERWKTFAVGAGCVLSLVLAAGSKETGFLSPVLLALYAGLFRAGEPRRVWIFLLAAAFLAVGLFAAARFGLEPETSAIFTDKPAYLGGSLAAVFAIQPRIWAFLVAQTGWPLHLSADYTPQNLAWITWPLAAVLLAAFLGAQLFLATRSRLALFGALLFWLGLAPVSNFVPIYRPIGDRFLYLPMAGLAALLCAALLLVRGRRPFVVLGALALAVELALVPIHLRRQAVFASALELWQDTLAKSPFSATAANNLGYALGDAGRYDASLAAFGQALGLTREKHADAWAGAAITLDHLRRPADADRALRKAIALDPRYAQPRRLVEALAADPIHAAAMEKIAGRRPAPPP